MRISDWSSDVCSSDLRYPVKRGESSMNAIIKCAVALTGILALAGCAGMEYDDAEMSSASGSSYQRDLHDEYVKLSKSEFDQGDYADSDKYAEKALALSNGEHVQQIGRAHV